MNYLKFTTILTFFLILTACTEQIKTPNVTGDYLGQTVFKDSSSIFAEGIISREFNERDLTISPDGNEIYFSLKGPSYYSIITLKRTNGIWSGPEVAQFSGKYSDIEPSFSPDGSKIFFVSNRPVKEGAEPKDYDIWYVEKVDTGWGTPVNPGPPLNTDANEFYPSYSFNNKLYFCSRNKMAIGGEDIFYSEFKEGTFMDPINLGDSINTTRDEFNAFISPKDDYLIYTTTGYGAGEGGGDLWISFKDKNNIWKSPKNLGSKINTNSLEFCPSVSPDGKYLFFTSNRGNTIKFSETKQSYSQIINDLGSTLNGNHNIYWISAEIIKSFK